MKVTFFNLYLYNAKKWKQRTWMQVSLPNEISLKSCLEIDDSWVNQGSNILNLILVRQFEEFEECIQFVTLSYNLLLFSIDQPNKDFKAPFWKVFYLDNSTGFGTEILYCYKRHEEISQVKMFNTNL